MDFLKRGYKLVCRPGVYTLGATETCCGAISLLVRLYNINKYAYGYWKGRQTCWFCRIVNMVSWFGKYRAAVLQVLLPRAIW